MTTKRRKSVRRTKYTIIDGDTVRVKRSINGSNYVRLSGYDAPEKGTKAGAQATKRLKKFLGNEPITVTPEGRSYGRIVGTVRRSRCNIKKL